MPDTETDRFDSIHALLTYANQQNASDLHLSSGMPALLRIDGDIIKIDMPVMEHAAVNRYIASTMNRAQCDEFQKHLEIDYAVSMPDIGRFRVNAYTQSRGTAAVFRAIPCTIPSLQQLELGGSNSGEATFDNKENTTPSLQSTFETIANFKQGLVLVTGPTGSGKSTTVAALIDFINSTRPAHILTIEDPIEFVHHSKLSLVNQREVAQHTLNFDTALRSALREDPDVIVIGELRDLTSIRLALTAAETGHLVFATLHTNSATKTIDRIIDVFPAAEKDMVRAMLSESLKAVISQVLVKRKQGGRLAAYEIMIATPAIRNLIRQNKLAQMYSVIQTGSSLGMRTLEHSLSELIDRNLIEPQTL